MRKLIVSAFIFAAGLVSVQVNAAFVHSDWKVLGDKKATLDTTTGLEWLKLPETLGKSISEVQSLLSTTLSGWRLPTKAEVNALFTPHFSSLMVVNEGYTTATYNGAWQGGWSSVHPQLQYSNNRLSIWSTWFGKTRDQTIYKSSYNTTHTASNFWYLDEATGNVLSVKLTNDYLTRNTGYRESTTVIVEDFNNGQSTLIKDSYTSVFLVSDGGTTLSSNNNPALNINNPNAPVNQVPEMPADVPVHAGFGLLGLLFIAFRLRRRKSA